MADTRIQELTEIVKTSKTWAEYIARLEKEQRDRIGRIQFKSIRRVDMRVQPFIPSKEQH